MKFKLIKLSFKKLPILLSVAGCCAAMLALTSCMLPSPEMMKNAMAMRGPMGMGSGGMNGIDAEEFSKKLVTLKIGQATKEECLAVLGQPGMTTENSLMYILKNTGSSGPVTSALFFKDGVLAKADVNKMSMKSGTVNNNSVYSKEM